MFPLFLFQPAQDSTAAPKEVSFSLYDVIVSSGTIGIILTLIMVIMGIFAIYILIERYLTIQRAGKVDESFMERIRTYVQSGDIENALNLCRNTDTPVARLVAKGLQRKRYGHCLVRPALHAVAKIRRLPDMQYCIRACPNR